MEALIPLLLLPLFLLSSNAANFTCTSSTARCQSLIGYTPSNATTLAAIKSLFEVRSLRSLLAANDLPLSTPSSLPIPSGSTTRIRFACRCSNGSGSSNRKPVYRVRPGDGLDSIARDVFNGFVTYQEIASANGISDPNVIRVGQRLWIPLPCSCDEVEGGEVVHYGHVVAGGSSLEGIAAEFGAAVETLMRLNGIRDPKQLTAGQILDVPLRACSSSIGKTSVDYNLHVPNGSYVLTANNCVMCSCSSLTWQLDCHPTQGISSGVCHGGACGNLVIGNTSSISPCERSMCTYAGYANGTILTNLTTQSLCNSSGDGEPSSQPSSGFALRIGLQGMSWMDHLVLLHLALLCFRFLWQDTD